MKKTIYSMFLLLIFTALFTGCPTPVSPEADHISLKAQGDGILITVTKENNWSLYYAVYLFIYEINNSSSDPIRQSICLHAENYIWQNNKATFLYPFTEKEKRYGVTLHGNVGGNTIEEFVDIVAAGGIGENPKVALLRQIRFEPKYDLSNEQYSVKLNATESVLSELVSNQDINNEFSLNTELSAGLSLAIYDRRYTRSGYDCYGSLYFDSSNVPRPQTYEFNKNAGFYYYEHTNPIQCFLRIHIPIKLLWNEGWVQIECDTSIEGNDFSIN